MMKRVAPCLILLLCAYTCFGSIYDDWITSDGYLTAGEYGGAGVDLIGEEKLIVDGGGAARIETWDLSRLEIYSTTLPLSLDEDRGVYDIHMDDNSTLLFAGGATDYLVVSDNAKAELRGGQINDITIFRYPQKSSQVTIYCQEGWQWLYNASQKKGITGLWGNGSEFTIQFINAGGPFSPTANFVNVVEVMPEPATVFLLGLGAVLLRRKESEL